MVTTKLHRAPDVIVVGGGPAGMMAAGRAAELGARTLLVEKTYRVGSKLLVTGGGRCNITNGADLQGFISAFGGNGSFLYRALKVFSSQDLMDFFITRGLEMRTDPDGKVFPADDRAESVLALLRDYLAEHKVRLQHNTAVSGIVYRPEENLRAGGIRVADGMILEAGAVIIATGGLSYPKTGSTGDGYELARQCGHSIVPLRPGLVPLVSGEPFIRELQGLTLKDIGITVLVDGKVSAVDRGDVLFTHYGLSGPRVLVLSGPVVDALAAGRRVEFSLNLRPGCSAESFEMQLQKELESCGRKTFSVYVQDALPASLAPVFERLCAVERGRQCSMIGREDRRRIAARFTDIRIPVSRPRPIEEATITRGGIALDELNPQTMESRLVRGLYFCGEMIDLDGITGGYNLQEAFSTGFLAGESAAANRAAEANK